MNIRYTNERVFNQKQLEKLFLSVGWESGKYPERLTKALYNCADVFTAWDGDELVGLVNVLGDGELTAYVHYLLVNPNHQGLGIGTALIDMVKEKYNNYLRLFLLAENKELVGYYEHLGFQADTQSTVMAYKER